MCQTADITKQDTPRDCVSFFVHEEGSDWGAETAAGTSFSNRTVRYLRAIGWLVIAGAVLDPALIHVTNPGQLGYSVEA